MKNPIIVVIGVIKKDNKFLLTKRIHEDKRFHDKWQLPGGELEYKETVNQCLHRELKEELGVEIINEKIINQYFENIRHDFHGVFISFTCNLKNSNAQIILDDEASDYNWYTKDEIMNFKDEDVLVGIKEIINNVK